MTEEDYTAVMARGTAAAALLADETFQQALDAVRADALETFEQLAPGSVGLMQTQHAKLLAVEDVRAKLRAWSDAATKTAFDTEKRSRIANR